MNLVESAVEPESPNMGPDAPTNGTVDYVIADNTIIEEDLFISTTDCEVLDIFSYKFEIHFYEAVTDPENQQLSISNQKNSLTTQSKAKPGLHSVGARGKYKPSSVKPNELKNDFRMNGTYVRPNISEILQNFPVRKKLYFIF
ncbi:hypothetical protein FQR65_LT06524 [Abscondita terminalis]|nr:hypothetical protein FQR65_LT06524 [Abscondita terminalis]